VLPIIAGSLMIVVAVLLWALWLAMRQSRQAA